MANNVDYLLEREREQAKISKKMMSQIAEAFKAGIKAGNLARSRGDAYGFGLRNGIAGGPVTKSQAMRIARAAGVELAYGRRRNAMAGVRHARWILGRAITLGRA